MQAGMQTYVRINRHAYRQRHVCIYIYIYIHMYTHTYIHTYIHTYDEVDPDHQVAADGHGEVRDGDHGVKRL